MSQHTIEMRNSDSEDEAIEMVGGSLDANASTKTPGASKLKKRKVSWAKSELENGGEDDEFDILHWWKSNAHRLPILSSLGRDVMAIPISTVASESAFGTGGRVLDSYRSSLTPRVVQALICAQDWLRNETEDSIDGEIEYETGEIDKVDLEFSKISLEPAIDQ